jgi:hypothetical protein
MKALRAGWILVVLLVPVVLFVPGPAAATHLNAFAWLKPDADVFPNAWTTGTTTPEIGTAFVEDQDLSGCGGAPWRCPVTVDWTGTSWGMPGVQQPSHGRALETHRAVWDTTTGSMLHWFAGASNDAPGRLFVYRCVTVDSCVIEDVDPGSANTHEEFQYQASYFRSWDLSIERSSGELLLVWDTTLASATEDFCYRTRTAGASGTWSDPETCVDHTSVASLGEVLHWMVLANNPSSNRIALGISDRTNSDFLLTTWDGSAWVNTGGLCSATVTDTGANGATGGTVLAEDTADEFVAYCGNGVDSTAECEWTSAGGWEGTCATFDADPDAGDDWVHGGDGRPLEGTNTGLVCYENDLVDNDCWVWEGVSGTGGTRTTIELTDNALWGFTHAGIGYDWNPDQSTTRDALVVYGDSVAFNLMWGTIDDSGNTFTAGAGVIDSAFFGSGFIQGYRTRQAANTVKVHILLRNDDNSDIQTYRWDGSTTAPGSLTTLSTFAGSATATMVMQTNPLIGCISHFDCVDDDPIQDGNTAYLISPATVQEEDFTLQNIATDITGIDQVTAFLWALAPNAGDTLTYVLAHGASVCATNTPILTTAYVNYTRVYTQNCAGGPWTAANVNDLEIRIENSVALDPRMTATGVVVQYAAPDEADTPPVSQTFLVDFTYRVEGDTVYFLDRTRNVSGLGLTYRWQFGDGAESFVREAWHVYPPTIWGTYTVTLTVCDPFICKSAARNVTVVQWDVVMLVVIVVAIAFTYAWVRKMERRERNKTVRRRGAR